MKLTINLLLLVVLSSTAGVAQNPYNLLYGEWTHVARPVGGLKKESIILKPDKKYAVFNNSIFGIPKEGMPPRKDSGLGKFRTDDGSLAYLTELGKWRCSLNHDSVFISFYKRNRDKNPNVARFNSNIARFYGKGDSISIYLKELTDRKLILCQYDAGTEPNCYMCPPEVEEEGGCYTYRKYKESDYKIVSKVLKGSGSLTDSLALSGSETEINLQYGFYSEADKLSLKDLQDTTIFSTNMRKTDSLRKEQITIRGVTRLKIDVKSSEPDSKWKLKFDIY